MPAIDITQPPLKLIFDDINLANSTNYDYKEFTVTPPQVYSKLGVKANTMINITPTVIGRYYGNKNLYYYRMNLADILDSETVEIMQTTETKLSELIPKINAAFAINLTSDDYYEQTIPAYDPNNSAVTRVTVMAKETSYLFYGHFSLVIGSRGTPIVDETGVTRLIYLLKSGVTEPNYPNMFTCLNTDGTVNTGFSFLRNASIVNLATINKVLFNIDGTILMSGMFDLTYQNFGDVTPTVVVATFITLDTNGAVLSFNSTGMRSNINVIASDKAQSSFYILDKTATGKANCIFKYNKSGAEITTYSSVGISYTPDIIKLAPDGTLYTVSPTYPNAKVRIDRLLASGSLDTTFTPIIISNTSVNTVMPVVNIHPVPGNGLWVLLNPSRGVSNNADTPIINDTPLIPSDVNVYAWNPVLRFRQNGLLEPAFSNLLKNNDANSIYQTAGSNLAIGNHSIVGNAVNVVFFSYKVNPITGYAHRQPIVFDDVGDITLLSGVNYSNMFRWTNSTAIIQQSNGDYLAFGNMLPKLPQDGYGSVISAIGRYSSIGAPIEVLYREDNTGLVDTNVAISEIYITETI